MTTIAPMIDYDPRTVQIVNLDQLPRGTGCRFLLVIEGLGPGDPFIAERWTRNPPMDCPAWKRIIRFRGAP